ncbi:histidine phosphatase family protein, partial [Mesorhizobium sp. M7A.T.Ca.TU.009.01.3.1]
MKQLLLLRHAKSSWDDPGLDDSDRPLAERGVKAARSIGRELAARGWLPDLALVSPALRTRDTWRLVAAEWPVQPRIAFVEALYDASAADILSQID